MHTCIHTYIHRYIHVESRLDDQIIRSCWVNCLVFGTPPKKGWLLLLAAVNGCSRLGGHLLSVIVGHFSLLQPFTTTLNHCFCWWAQMIFHKTQSIISVSPIFHGEIIAKPNFCCLSLHCWWLNPHSCCCNHHFSWLNPLCLVGLKNPQVLQPGHLFGAARTATQPAGSIL